MIKEVLNTKGKYMVSRDGRVFLTEIPKCCGRKDLTVDGWLELKQSICNKYLRVLLNKRRVPVHRIVLMSFSGINSDLQIDHIDGDKMNNNLSNLEYVSAMTNVRRSIEMGLCDNRDCSKRMFSDDQIIDIRKMFNNGSTYKQVQEKYDVTEQTLAHIKFNRTYRHVKITPR